MPQNNLITFRSIFCQTKAEIYHEISKEAANHQLTQKEIKDALLFREQLGEIRLSEAFLLPHFESPYLLESKVLVWKLAQVPSNPKEALFGLRFVIAVLLKEQEQEHITKEIVNFMRLLADETFGLALLNIQDESELKLLIKTFRKGKK